MSFSLRPDQAHVAAYRKGSMAVPAVPGAGKTTVLAYLAADLIASGESYPGKILIVTYTNSAVGNFKSRIAEFLEQRGFARASGYEVRTIHSLALQIVRERPEEIGWSDEFTIADETFVADLMGRLTGLWIERNREVWTGMIRDELKGSWRERAETEWVRRTQDLCRSLIQAFKSRKLSPEAALGLTRHLPETSALRWAAELYGEYQQQLGMQGVVDFGDLMLGAHQLLSRDSELLDRLQRRWSYIFEDEAQDSYRLQEEVLRLLTGPGGNLVRVGDSNQAIMGTFTSAEPDLFRRFCREAGVSLRPLTMAGRSSPDIIDLANELVRWTRESHPDPRLCTALEEQQILPVPPPYLPANPRPDRYNIRTRIYGRLDEELQATARQAAAVAAKYPEKTLAILAPTNGIADDLVKHLTEAGVPVQVLGGPTSDERLQTASDLAEIIRYLAEPHRTELETAALGRLEGTCQPGTEGLLSSWLAQTLLPPDELLLLVATDLGLAWEEMAIAHHLALRVRRLLQEHPGHGLTGAAAGLEAEIQAMGRFTDAMFDRQGFRPEPGVVYVATCHAAKGLEWETVFVVALTRGEFPSMPSDKVRSELWFLPEGAVNPEALALAELTAVMGEGPAEDPAGQAKLEIISERLRLLYVAVTRARENLMLSCHEKDRWGKAAAPALAFQHLRAFARTREGGEGGGS